MLKLERTQTIIADVFSGDPALMPPPADPNELEVYRTALAECKRTGNWDALLAPGASPTKFMMGPVGAMAWAQLCDLNDLPVDCKRRPGEATLAQLLFRLSLRDVVGLEGHTKKIERHVDQQWGWEMVSIDVVEALNDIDPGIVNEIALGVLRRQNRRK